MSGTDALIGAVRGIDSGLQTAGAIQSLWRQQEAAKREDELYPMRKKDAENRVSASGLQLQEEQEKRAALDQPWDYKGVPGYQYATPEGKLYMDSVAKTVPPTRRGAIQMMQRLAVDEKFGQFLIQGRENALKEKVTTLGAQVLDLQGKLTALPQNAPERPELMSQYEKLMQEYRNTEAQINATRDNAGKYSERVNLNNVMIRNKDEIEKDPNMKLAAELSAQTGDATYLKKALEAKQAVPTRWEAMVKTYGVKGALDKWSDTQNEPADKTLPPSYNTAIRGEIERNLLMSVSDDIKKQLRNQRSLDPKTVLFEVLPVEQQRKYLAIEAGAAELLQSGKAKTVQAAVKQAMAGQHKAMDIDGELAAIGYTPAQIEQIKATRTPEEISAAIQGHRSK